MKKDRKAIFNKASRKSREIHPERWSARLQTREAVKKGLIKKLPCEVCGELSVQAHHYRGYDYPLEVKWLCKAHHLAEHRKINGWVDDMNCFCDGFKNENER